MQAVILAGGQGTRLRPYTASLPKPLVPIGDAPIIEIVLRQLKGAGFREVVIATGHLAELVKSFCGDGRRWGLKIRYARETKPLSTAGALRMVKGLDDDFLTVNGDILTTLDYRELFEFHRRRGAAATVGVCQRSNRVNFGVIGLDGSGALASYTEKPEYRYLVSQGVNAFNRKALSLIGKGERLGIPDLILRLKAAGELVLGYRNQASWLDIGRPEDYESAQRLFASPARRGRYLAGL